MRIRWDIVGDYALTRKLCGFGSQVDDEGEKECLNDGFLVDLSILVAVLVSPVAYFVVQVEDMVVLVVLVADLTCLRCSEI